MDHQSIIKKLNDKLDLSTCRLRVPESGTVEFKRSFNWSNRAKYAKSIAAFANNRGGYLIFGVTDRPRTLVGLSSSRFEDLDEADITAYLNSLFSPEIVYEKFSEEVAGKEVGFLYVHQSDNRPVVASKTEGDIKEAEIYYRYNARNDKIKFPELKALIDLARERERKSWEELFARISKIGPTNAGIMDIVEGTIESKGRTLLIDKDLLSKIKFIMEGRLSDAGSPTLKVVGDVTPVHVSTASGKSTAIRITDDPTAIAVREEDILKNYPLTYHELVGELSGRYTDFKTNQKFHGIRMPLMKNSEYCRSRYLDPTKRSGAKKDFYSREIIKEFDKHYTRKRSNRSTKKTLGS